MSAITKRPAYWFNGKAFASASDAGKAAIAKLAADNIKPANNEEIEPDDVAAFIVDHLSAIQDLVKEMYQ